MNSQPPRALPLVLRAAAGDPAGALYDSATLAAAVVAAWSAAHPAH